MRASPLNSLLFFPQTVSEDNLSLFLSFFLYNFPNLEKAYLSTIFFSFPDCHTSVWTMTWINDLMVSVLFLLFRNAVHALNLYNIESSNRVSWVTSVDAHRQRSIWDDFIRFSSATLLQLAFLEESDPYFPGTVMVKDVLDEKIMWTKKKENKESWSTHNTEYRLMSSTCDTLLLGALLQWLV